jgi:GR25 family glycosyltransferase involved in LPS biosynthesis
MIIDKIFIINLAHRTDRKEHMINEMKKQNISNYEFFDAIRPTLKEVNEWNSNYCNYVKKDVHPLKFDNYRIGCLGCLKSHIEVIKIALTRNYKNILILEDDTEFITDISKLYEYSEQIDNNYDMLYLCGSHLGIKTNISNNIKKIIGTYTTGSYCISYKAMKYFVDNINRYEKEIDVFYATVLQKNLHCYCTYPHITKQCNGFSDIQQNFVNYKLN